MGSRTSEPARSMNENFPTVVCDFFAAGSRNLHHHSLLAYSCSRHSPQGRQLYGHRSLRRGR